MRTESKHGDMNKAEKHYGLMMLGGLVVLGIISLFDSGTLQYISDLIAPALIGWFVVSSLSHQDDIDDLP